MKRFNIKSFLTKLFLCGIVVFFSSCSYNEDAQQGYASITQKKGDPTTTINFDIPPNGSERIFARKGTASFDKKVTAYYIEALSGNEIPYNTLDVEFIPAYTDQWGNYCSPKAYVRITEYTEPITGNYYPKKYFYEINSSSGLSTDDYHCPITDGGIFSLNFSCDYEHPVEGNSDYSELTYALYPLLNVSIIAPTK